MHCDNTQFSVFGLNVMLGHTVNLFTRSRMGSP